MTLIDSRGQDGLDLAIQTERETFTIFIGDYLMSIHKCTANGPACGTF